MLGIDVSSSACKVLELSRTDDHCRVERYAVEPLPQNSVVEHAITEVEQVAQAVERAVKRSGSRCKHAAVAVAGVQKPVGAEQDHRSVVIGEG
ncbi:MAG: pilus assembly protein PilM, partial [Proteobacteria bacterium]|nr:pilus assembly protein PilM [Pseudomonadota bacterium]